MTWRVVKWLADAEGIADEAGRGYELIKNG
jgi:hypothetical protein